MAQITVAICGGGPGPANRLYSEWYCQRHSLGQKLITSMVPTILLVLWQNLVMPNVFYRRAPLPQNPAHLLMLAVLQ